MELYDQADRYYAHPETRRIIREYIGADRADARARYLVGSGLSLVERGWSFPVTVRPPGGLDDLLAQRLDVFRSVSGLAYDVYTLDIEYQHPYTLHYLYWNTREVYSETYPVFERVLETLRSHGVDPLLVFTPSGIHMDFTVDKGGPAFARLAGLSYVNDDVIAKCALTDGGDLKRSQPTPARDARAYAGVGVLLEAVCADTMLAMDGQTDLGLAFMDSYMEFERTPKGVISFDLSMFGDPVYMRVMRCAGSLHQKNWMNPGKYGTEGELGGKVLRTAVGGAFDPDETIRRMTDLEDLSDLADASGEVPDVSGGIPDLLDWYGSWPGRRFHDEFREAAAAVDRSGDLARYEKELPELPFHIRQIIDEPYPHALRPTNVQWFVTYCADRGLGPEPILGCVARQLKKVDFALTRDSNTNWAKYDPVLRAMNMVRMYWTLHRLKNG